MSTTQPLANLADMVRERAASRGNAISAATWPVRM